MNYWDDSLRICPKCKRTTSFASEERKACPACGANVWFFNFQEPPPPPSRPIRSEKSIVRSKLSFALLVACSVLAILALIGVFMTWVLVVVCSLIAIGFGVFGAMRHAETCELEDKLENVEKVYDYSKILEKQLTELTERYKHLLRTGDKRIEHYHKRIYVEAERRKQEAAQMVFDAIQARKAVESVEERIYQMAERLINDHLKWVSQKLRSDPDNYQRQKTALTKTFDFVESVGYQLPDGLRKRSLDELKYSYQQKVREQNLKDEQRRIKQQMQEEERVRREREKAIKEAEQREKELQQMLDEALRQQEGQYSAEIEELQRQLQEAQVGAERAKSQAQLTRSGHVYVLSNIGSFGEGVFKVGMTRRLEPLQRVYELGDASVPFPFDVHAMIQCDDAPDLEKRLHHELNRHRVNRVNFRKEYFRVDLDEIFKAVERNHGKVEYVAEPEALEYRETLLITPDELVELEQDLVEIGVDFESEDDDL